VHHPEIAVGRVDRWFAENTYHNNEFSNLQALLAMKGGEVTISIARR
jgi:hypothetical protein